MQKYYLIFNRNIEEKCNNNKKDIISKKNKYKIKK